MKPEEHTTIKALDDMAKETDQRLQRLALHIVNQNKLICELRTELKNHINTTKEYAHRL